MGGRVSEVNISVKFITWSKKARSPLDVYVTLAVMSNDYLLHVSTVVHIQQTLVSNSAHILAVTYQTWLHPQLLRSEPNNTEHDDAWEYWGDGVCQTNNKGIDKSVVSRLAVTGQSYENTERETERKEYLCGSFQPNLRREGLSKLREGERERGREGGKERERERSHICHNTTLHVFHRDIRCSLVGQTSLPMYMHIYTDMNKVWVTQYRPTQSPPLGKKR